MESTHTDQCVSKFLKELLEIGGLYTVDDTPDKFIRNRVTGEVERAMSGDKNLPLAIYGTYNADSLILNPFSEGEAKSTQASWFFSNTNICLAMNILAMMTKLLEIGVNQNKTGKDAKGKKDSEEPMLDMKLVDLLAPVAKDIDEKILQELKTISKPSSNFFMVFYNKKTACTEVTSILTSDVKKKAFDSKSVRNKTWTVLETLLLRLLSTDDLSEFLYKPKTSMCRVFEGFSFVLTKVYSRLNEYSSLLIGKEFNTVNLESHLSYFEQYAKTAYWCHGAMVFEDRKNAPQMPQTANLPMNTVPVSTVPGYNNLTPAVGVPGMTPMMTPGMTPPVSIPGMMPAPMIPTAMPMVPIYAPQPTANTNDVVNENPFSRV